jgi:hypothetical protein
LPSMVLISEGLIGACCVEWKIHLETD